MNIREVNLILYMPEHLREMIEFRQMCRAEDIELQLLWSRLATVVNEMDMYTMSKEMCERWESFFDIKDVSRQTIDERRQRIRGYFASQIPYTIEKLEMILRSMCGDNGYEINEIPSQYKVDVGIALDSSFAMDNVIDVLKKMIPAHVNFNVYLMYARHRELEAFTHGRLGNFSHDDIKEKKVE